MQKLRKISLCFLVIITLVLSSACQSAAEDTPSPSPAEVTADVMSQIDFGDPQEISLSDITRYYDFDVKTIESMSAFKSPDSNDTADEIAVFKFVTVSEAEGAYGALAEHLEMQKENFSGNKTELNKLSDPVCQQFGLYLVYCASNDNTKAEDIIVKLFTV